MPSELPDLRGEPSLARALSAGDYRAALEDALPGFLEERRWFADRAAGAFDARIEECVPLSTDGVVVIVIVRVESAAGVARYQVPLLASPSGGVVDALDSAAGAALFLDAISRPVADERLTVTVLNPEAIGGPPRIMRGEQSNTSVVFGDACILKLFRRLAEGRNPDVELTTWLSGPGAFGGVPQTLAWARLDFGGWNADSLVIQQYVANDGDGWEWALERAREANDAVTSGTPFATWLSSADGIELLDGAAALGRVTAKLHSTLASATGDGLGASPFSRDDWDALATRIHEDIDAAVASALTSTVGSADFLSRLHRCVPGPPDSPGSKARIHGDYHLGQVLRTGSGWVIVDFEGEPARPLSDRVAPQHPLADVAGMVRSWDYAAATAAGQAMADWRTAATAAFVDAYREEAAGSAFLPGSPEAEDRLLRMFVLRKALYELRYELDSRPAWAAIPLAALERIATEVR
jgi:trehalose synthase-fused probable maltokinase